MKKYIIPIICIIIVIGFICYKDFKINNPEAKITINRIDNDGNYCPTNCEWSDMYNQNNNTSRNKHYLYYGEWYTVAQLITNFAPYALDHL